MTPEQITDMADRIGIPAAIIFSVLLVGGPMAYAAFRALFGKNGMLWTVTNRHMSFVDSCERQNDKITETTREIVSIQHDQRRDGRNLAAAMCSSADALYELANGAGPEVARKVKPHVDAIKQALRA